MGQSTRTAIDDTGYAPIEADIQECDDRHGGVIENQECDNETAGSQEWGDTEAQGGGGGSQEWPHDPGYNHPGGNSIYDTPGEHQVDDDIADGPSGGDEG